MKVRIYKSPDGNGKYLNKTGQFLEKAQTGKVIGKVLKNVGQLMFDFDKADEIQKATELAKGIDKANKAGRAAGAIKYGEGIKKATTASSKIHVKNPAFFQEVLNSSNLSPSTRKYHEEVIKAVMKNNNLATQSQYNTLQRIKNGTFPKYQAGGVPDVSEMGYPGSAKENKEYTQDDLVNLIVNDLNNDIDEQKIAFKLSSFYSVDPMEAMQLVDQVKDYLNNADDSEEEEDDYETKNQNIVEEEVPEEEVVDNTNEEESAALANDSTGIDLALEEDEEEDEEYSYGGMYKAQEGEEVDTEISQNFQTPSYPFNPTAPEITFPSIDTYLPFNISDMLDGTIDPATGIYANYYNNEDDVVEEDVEEDVEDTSDYALDTPPEMKMGGNYKRNKKAYVNSIIKLSKKADGGEEVKSDEDPEAGDPTGAKIRKQKLNNFIGSLKKETEMFNLKQQAEQQYDQMMQQQMQLQNDMMRRGGPAGSRDPKVVRGNELRYRANQLRDFITGQNRRDRKDNIEYYNVNDYPTTTFEEGDYNKDGYTDAMDFANSPEQLKLRNNTTNQNQVFSSTEPKIGQTYDDWWVTSTGETPGFKPDNRKWNGKDWVSRAEYYGNSDYGNNVSYDHPSYSIDVRKSNWLTGRPSKYTIDFYGNSPLINIVKGNTTISNIPKVKVYEKLVSSKTTPVNTISTSINKESTNKIDTDLKNKSQVLSNDFYTRDNNKDLIPDYLQPGIMSGLSTDLFKDVFLQAAVDAVNNLSSIKSNVIPKSNIIIPQVPVKPIIPVKPIPLTIIKPKVITKNKTKDKTKGKNKIKYEDVYRDPTYYEQFQRFFGTGPMETGGFVDSENPDLYEFNQGGYDPTQQDIDYSNSIDTTDPYFQRGGGVRKFIEDYFPGNIISPKRTYRNEIQRVYDPRTGKTVVMPMDMGNLSRVHVDKSRFWSGKPKKYTMYFNGSTSKPIINSNNNTASQTGRNRFCSDFPNSPNCRGNTQNNNQRSNTDGLSLKAKRAINKGERSVERNSRRLERRGLDEYGNPIGGNNQGAIIDENGRFTKDREGNWYDRNDNIIPGKKRPSEVPDYYNSNQKTANEPISNAEMLTGQGKVWDEKTQNWIMKPQMRFGGDLEIFIPRAQEGFQAPLTPGECPMGSTKNAAGDCVDFMGKVVKKRSTGSDFGNNTPEIKQPGVIDENYKNPLTGQKPGVIKGADGNLKINEKTPSFNDMYAIDVENKNNRGKLTFGANADTSVNETRLGLFNTGVDMLDSASRNRDYQKSAAEMQENTSSNNQYTNKTTMDFGDYDPNSGLFRPNEMGQKRDGRSAQYGGYIDEEEYYDPYTEKDEEDELTYAEGGEKITYMSEDQIRAFMAEGGQVEFL